MRTEITVLTPGLTQFERFQMPRLAMPEASQESLKLRLKACCLLTPKTPSWTSEALCLVLTLPGLCICGDMYSH